MSQADIAAASEPRRLIPALSTVYDALSPYSYPLIRFVAGAALIPHGWGKLVEGGISGTAGFMAKLGLQPAYALATYVGLLELVGGAMLALGLLTRLVAIQVVGFMAVAAFYVHWPNGYLWGNGGFEYPLFWGLVALAITLRGGGRLSLDRAIGIEL